MPAPWVGLHVKRTSKNAEATHATHTSTLGNPVLNEEGEAG